MKIQSLIFDWDGTLHDTAVLYGQAFRTAVQPWVEQGVLPAGSYSDREMSKYLGMSIPEMWHRFAPDLPESVWKPISEEVGRQMNEQLLQGLARLYPGTEETLTTLKKQGFQLIFLSNCSREYMRAQKEHFQLERWFNGFYCCQDYDNMPKERIFAQFRDQYPGKYCVIGDRQSDLKVAQVWGLHSIGCAWGFGTAEELSTAEQIAAAVTDIPQLLNNINMK